MKTQFTSSLFGDVERPRLELRGTRNSEDAVYTGCHRRNGPNFGRVFLM